LGHIPDDVSDLPLILPMPSADAQPLRNGDYGGEDRLMEAPQKGNTCAIVVTYHPGAALSERLARVVHQVGAVMIVDNGSAESCVGQLKELAGTLRVHLILNSRNEGIARALNQGARWAAEQGYRWVLNLDQDTVVAPDIVESLAKIYRASTFQDELAVIGSNFTNFANGRPFHEFAELSGYSGREVKTVITSGSLVSLRVFQIIGGFRDEFFIDCVDFDYCLRARARGFRVMMSRKPLMQHAIGAVTSHKLPWKRTGTSNHSPVRRYYMTRNRVVLAREYMWKDPLWILSTLYSHAKSTVSMCLFEKDAQRKLKYTAIGVFDGLFSHFKRNLS
jgi:rhamnosyltransferase